MPGSPREVLSLFPSLGELLVRAMQLRQLLERPELVKSKLQRKRLVRVDFRRY
jgi:hypothetical protein